PSTSHSRLPRPRAMNGGVRPTLPKARTDELTPPGINRTARRWSASERSNMGSLAGFTAEERDDVLILFSAHSLPLSVVNRGDAYPAEVGASTHEVMKRLGYAHQYLISYQSEVGPVPWLGPSTESVVRELGAKGRRNVLVVPVAFTSDHIETLHELDIEYGHLAAEVGVTNYRRAPALNDAPAFLDALAAVVAEHLASGEACSLQYGLRCPGCVN